MSHFELTRFKYGANAEYQPNMYVSARKTWALARPSSENVPLRFCRHFSMIPRRFGLRKVHTTYAEIKLINLFLLYYFFHYNRILIIRTLLVAHSAISQRLGYREKTLTVFRQALTSSTPLRDRSFDALIGRERLREVQIEKHVQSKSGSRYFCD